MGTPTSDMIRAAAACAGMAVEASAEAAGLRKRIAELEAALRNWRDNYAGSDANVIPVPRYQIDRLLGE